MAFRVSLEIDGDSTGGQKALADLNSELRKSDEAFAKTAKSAMSAQTALNAVPAAASRVGQGVAQTGTAVSNVAQLSSLQLQNLQFQMQDIGVSLASGQSPFRVMLQQGSQIVQMFGPGTGVLGAMRAVGSGVVTFLTNPLNLALIGFAAVTAGVDLFARKLGEGAEKAEEKEEKVLSLKEAIEELDEVTGRANKTHEEELKASEATLRTLLNEEIATRKLTKARLDAAIAQREALQARSVAPGASAEGAALRVPGAFAAVDRLEKQLKENNEAIAEAEAALRGAVADRAQITVENLLDPVAAATAKFEEAENTLRKEFEAGKITILEYALAQHELATARDRTVEAARKEKRSSKSDKDDRTAVEKLTEAKQRELDLLRESDPVKQEMIRLGEQLRGASEAERKAVMETIAEIEKETAARDAAKKAKEDQTAAKELIGDLKEELDVLRALDPAQQELIRLRSELAGATAEQAAEIRALIPAIEAERAANEERKKMQREATRAYEQLGRAGVDAMRAILLRTDSAGRIMKEFAVNIGLAVAQAALLGQGPLAGLFGGAASKGVGGFIGSLFSSLAGGGGGGSFNLALAGVGAAKGGYITGPGTSTSDSIPARLSTGEYVVNAESTRRNRGLLEAINSGAPGFARGGYVGGASAPSSMSGASAERAAPSFTVVVNGARGNQEIREMVAEGVGSALTAYDHKLTYRMRAISADPRRIG